MPVHIVSNQVVDCASNVVVSPPTVVVGDGVLTTGEVTEAADDLSSGVCSEVVASAVSADDVLADVVALVVAAESDPEPHPASSTTAAATAPAVTHPRRIPTTNPHFP
jgi:hypothetical protein